MCIANCTTASEEGTIRCSTSVPQHREKLLSSAAQCALHYNGRTDVVITRWNYEDVDDLIELMPHYDQMINSIQVMK